MADSRHVENQKSPYRNNGLTNPHKIWHSDTHWPTEPDRQLEFRTFKNPRWRIVAIVKNRKMAISPRRFDQLT